MSRHNPWILGLQWGACAWLGYVSVLTTMGLVGLVVLSCTGEPLPHGVSRWMALDHGLFQSAAWLVAFALVIMGSRWSRAAVGIAIVGQCSQGLAWGFGCLPMCVPLLPLVVLRVEEPRVVVALLALGRWREALARSGGLRAALVVAGLVSLNRVLLGFL